MEDILTAHPDVKVVPGENDPDAVGRIAVDVGVEALDGTLPASFPKLDIMPPAVITKDKVDKYIRPNAVF